MPPETVEAAIDAARRAWGFANRIEITLEANPGSVEAGRFEAYRAAGVERVSLGVQALSDEALSFLGRTHSVAEARAAIEIAAAAFERRSFDLIYARPGQTVDAWRRELGAALDLAGGHLSVYQLTIEPGTAFDGAYRRGAFALPDEDIAADLYEATQAMLLDAGLPAYEISNHAAPGEESRHNLIYWRAGDWVGVGPGAHGRLTLAEGRTAFRQTRAPDPWLRQVEADGIATAERVTLADDDIASEALLMGLRLVEGVDRARFRAQTGRDVRDWVDAAGLERLVAGGFVTLDDHALRSTSAGRQRLNAVLERLSPG